MNEPASLNSTVSTEARDWVMRLASGEMDEGEIDRFKIWLAESESHARAFEQSRSLWLKIGEHPEVFAGAELPPVRPRRNPLRRMSGVATRRPVATAASAIAACLVAIVAGPELMLRIEADQLTSAHVEEHTLPDGSAMWLDAGSAISVDYDDRERRITLLRGNAYFTVKHGDDRPFRVAAHQGTVEDIGTSFEVRLQTDQARVDVTQGMVRVFPVDSGDNSIILREGQGAGYSASGAMLGQAGQTRQHVAAWRRNELMIERRSLEAAVRQIARYRDGPTWIWADLSGRERINGAFRIDDADAALRDLAAVQGLKIVWLPGDIAIVEDGP